MAALLARVPAAHGLPEVLADYRVGAGSLSGDKLVAARATWRLYREVEGLSLPRARRLFPAHTTSPAAPARPPSSARGGGTRAPRVPIVSSHIIPPLGKSTFASSGGPVAASDGR